MTKIKCPNCSREFVRRVSRVGFAERVISLFYVYPFICQLCGVRFRVLRWGVRYIRVEEDRRLYDRLEVTCPVIFSGDGVSGDGTVIEVSMGGCSFSTGAQASGGMILKLSLKVSSDAAPLLVDAAVVRYARPEAVGVEFLKWQPGERDRMRQFIGGLLTGRRE